MKAKIFLIFQLFRITYHQPVCYFTRFAKENYVLYIINLKTSFLLLHKPVV